MTNKQSLSPNQPATPPDPTSHLKMSEAMRAEGVDEATVAQTYKSLLERASAKSTTADAKLLLDTVRDCAKILEPPSEAEGLPENAVIQLVHNVARPDLEAESDAPPGKGL
jgi:hypothetical protein